MNREDLIPAGMGEIGNLKENPNGTKKRGVVYTCITGGYDELRDHDFIHHDWDYICFTDEVSVDRKKNIQWQVKELRFADLDDVRNQRWHKTHPHILFPEYQESIYVDANVNFLNSTVFDIIDGVIEEKNIIAIPVHPERNCIYDELIACITLGKDNEAVMRSQVELIRLDSFPREYGLFVTSIIYRNHLDKQVDVVMEDWWWWIKNYSRRDQLSLTYVLWKNNAIVTPLPNLGYLNDHGVMIGNFCWHVTKEELIVQRANLMRVIEEKDVVIVSYQQTVGAKDAVIESLNRKLDKLLKSSSWRMTQPVRDITEYVRRQSRKIRHYLLNKGHV